MRISRINIQQTLLIINNKKNSQQIRRQIQSRSNNMTNQISIFNSVFDAEISLEIAQDIEFLTIRKSTLKQMPIVKIIGINLKIVQLPNCQLKEFPLVHSSHLHKLNVSHNQIQQILQIKNKSLKLLDIRNNKLVRITRDIYNQHLTVLYQFPSRKHQQSVASLPLCLRPLVLKVDDIVIESIKQWDNEQLIQVCEQIIQNNNSLLLSQIISYLSEQFVNKIFQMAKIKRKHILIELLIKTSNCNMPQNQQLLQLLMPQYISQAYLLKVNQETIIKILGGYNNDKERVTHFFQYLTRIQKQQNFYIQSEKDLINFMTMNVKFPNHYEVEFLITQIEFFKSYDFSNQTILKYLLYLDNLQLLHKLLQLSTFKDKIFGLGLYRKVIKSNKKIFKILLRQDKNYQKTFRYKGELYFPEYRQRKSFCLKNDLYDYQILTEYEQMQCSYFRKNLKYTIKFCNKENEISVAKKIQTQLKKRQLKAMQHRRSTHSTSIDQF